jgi:integrase
MEEKLLVYNLAQHSVAALREFGLSEKTIRNYWRLGFTPILNHFNASGQALYSNAEVENFLKACRAMEERGEMSLGIYRIIRKCSSHLTEMAASGLLRHTKLSSRNFLPAGAVFEGYIADFSEYLLASGYCATTVRAQKPIVRHFLRYVEALGHTGISTLTRAEAISYLPILAESYTRVGDSLGILRSFGRFLLEKNLTYLDLTAAFSMKASLRKRHVTGFTRDEVEQIIGAVDRNTAVGKRDYAILLLASYTGLRAIDVLNIRFESIGWDSREVSVVQSKTKRPIVLPVEMSVLNAIADYILNGRPESGLAQVFLRHRFPYVQLKNTTGWAIVKRYAKRAGISWRKGECKGFHSFRRSIASWMLEAEVPVDTIRDVLGHNHRDSSKPYITVQQKLLSACALDLSGIKTSKEELS